MAIYNTTNCELLLQNKKEIYIYIYTLQVAKLHIIFSYPKTKKILSLFPLAFSSGFGYFGKSFSSFSGNFQKGKLFLFGFYVYGGE